MDWRRSNKEWIECLRVPHKKMSKESRQNMSEARRKSWAEGTRKGGWKVSEEGKQRMSESKARGENHWNWNGGSSRYPYSVDWTQTLKRSIRERDKYTCQTCGELQSDRAFCVHHIDGNKQNCNPDNLITMCLSCHMKLHNNKKYAK